MEAPGELLQSSGFTYMVNTVGEEGNEVAAHHCREHWGREVQDCAEVNEDRRV